MSKVKETLGQRAFLHQTRDETVREVVHDFRVQLDTAENDLDQIMYTYTIRATLAMIACLMMICGALVFGNPVMIFPAAAFLLSTTVVFFIISGVMWRVVHNKIMQQNNKVVRTVRGTHELISNLTA